jgi:hypothetical protein
MIELDCRRGHGGDTRDGRLMFSGVLAATAFRLSIRASPCRDDVQVTD